jgi:hypothetical protein
MVRVTGFALLTHASHLLLCAAGLLQDVITMFNSFPYEYDYELESSWVSDAEGTDIGGQSNELLKQMGSD